METLDTNIPDVNQEILLALNKEQLVDMVLSLTQTVSKMQEDYKAIINLRIYNLERNMNMMGQYSRRDTLEVSGIPLTVKDDELEKEMIEIF